MIESNYGCSASYSLTNPSSYVAINEQKDSLDDNYFWEDYNDYSQVDYSRLSSYDEEGNEKLRFFSFSHNTTSLLC